MPFDGIAYDAASFLWPNHASPGAPVDGVTTSSALEAGYYVARCHNQMLVSEATAWNGQRASVALGTSFSVFSADFVRWTDNPVWIASGATHLLAHIVYAAQPLSDAVAHFRVGTYAPGDDSFATPVRGDATEWPVHAGGFGLVESISRVEGVSLAQEFSVQDLAAEGRVYEADARLKLASPSPGYDTRVFVEGYVGGTLAVSFRPLYVTIWWESLEEGVT